MQLLHGYSGYLQTDGYAGYNEIGSQSNIIHVGCFAHARRYFFDASKIGKKSDTAKKGLHFIKEIYNIEKKLRLLYLSSEQFIEKRKLQVNHILDNFHKWLQEKVIYLPPETASGKAVNYTLNKWPKLIKYLDTHFLTPDNNLA